jgi:DNA-directed RNA polymerase specialized sigma24 family protein
MKGSAMGACTETHAPAAGSPSPAGHATGEDLAGTTGIAAPNADEELFQSIYPQLAGWVRRLVEDDDTAHEIASEAFVRLLSRWTRVDNPHDYLCTIAGNLIRDRHTARR